MDDVSKISPLPLLPSKILLCQYCLVSITSTFLDFLLLQEMQGIKKTLWNLLLEILPPFIFHSIYATASPILFYRLPLILFFVLSAVLLHGEESCCCCCCCHHLTISSFASWNLSLKLISQLWTVPFKSSRGFKALEDKNCDTGQRPVAVISSHAQAQLQWSHCSPHYLEMVQKPDWYSYKYMNSPQCATRDW